MKTFVNPSLSSWPSLCERPLMDSSGLEVIVKEILQKVRNEGDKALFELTAKFEGAILPALSVPYSVVAESEQMVPAAMKKALETAKANIEKFHSAQLCDEEAIETFPGVRCWRKTVPLERVGLYIPGGNAPLFSTVMMLAIPAKIAGCKEIMICTPPGKGGEVNPLILYAAMISGVTKVFRVGGAQAVAAMAFGTGSIPKADKIFGPGNQYVTKAKELVQSEGIPIDVPAGPSEVLVIADDTADPSFVAADLLAQAEHGVDSQVVLLSTSKELLTAVESEIRTQAELLPRKEIAVKALENSLSVQFSTLEECIDFSNMYAPEHLIITTSDPEILSDKITNAGSVFLGKYSCESAGDYATGTNHTLPTNGFARSYSGVTTDSFMKKISFQELSAEGIRKLGPVIELMAEAELLTGHKNAVTLRLKSLKDV